MKKILISTGILAVLAAGGAWLYHEQISMWWGQDSAQKSAVDPHAGHVMPAPATQTKPGERKILYWYDPMHPQYRSDKPGTAPDCGMDLVPRYAEEESAREMPAGAVQISAQKQQLIGVKTAHAEARRVERTLRAIGRVTMDETQVSHIHTKVGGFIEEVFADYVGKPVKAGDPLFTIYSPDLVATQQEYLVALRGREQLKDSPYHEVSTGADSLVRAARERLRLWDVGEAEIARLEREGTVKRTITIYSPVSGIVTERAAFHHGRTVTPETDIYTIVDFSRVWVIAEFFEFEAPFVQLGQEVTVRLSYLLGKTYNGKVSYIYPTVDTKTRTVRVRIDLPNPSLELKPDMYADVELRVDYGTHVVVPREAVLDAGTEQIVFVALPDGYFEPRRVKLGPRLAGLPRDSQRGEEVIIASGLKPHEVVVTSANFLIDSESRLKSATPGTGQHQH